MRAFQALKDKLCNALAMQVPDWEWPFSCHVNALALAVGGTLTQLDSNGHDRVVAYFSKRLNSAEDNYSANDRELVAWFISSRGFGVISRGLT